MLTILAASPALAAQLALHWKDNAGNETGFVVERRANPSGSYAQIATLGANAVGYTDTTVTAGQGYCYRVRAYNGAGSSGYTNEACGTASASAPPPPSQNPSFAVGETSTSPSAVARGQSFTVTTTVTNTGGQSTSGTVVNVEIRNAAGTKILQTSANNQTFSAGQSRQFNFTLAIPATLAPGTYYADVSVFNASWSTMYVYQWHAATFTVTSGTVPAGQPTFRVDWASATPSPIARGQWLGVTASVTNTSGQPASGIVLDIEVKEASGVKILQQIVVNQTFSPGQTRQVSVGLQIPGTLPGGTYYVDVAVFNASWSAMYAYQYRAASFAVQ